MNAIKKYIQNAMKNIAINSKGKNLNAKIPICQKCPLFKSGKCKGVRAIKILLKKAR